MDLALTDRLTPCYNDAIPREYAAVLRRDKFNFLPSDINRYLDNIVTRGLRVEATPSDLSFADESDRPFYETAKTANAYLVTGNAKHFPDEPFIVSPSKFLELFEARK
jgi:predicted nucleic acid-binding protein